MEAAAHNPFFLSEDTHRHWGCLSRRPDLPATAAGSRQSHTRQTQVGWGLPDHLGGKSGHKYDDNQSYGTRRDRLEAGVWDNNLATDRSQVTDRTMTMVRTTAP